MNTGLWVILAGFCCIGAVAIITALRKEYTDNAEYLQMYQDYDKEEGVY